jgi:hypothetical protein
MRISDIRAYVHHHRDRQIEEVRHDPYRERGKPAEPAICPTCGLVHHAGRWQRIARPTGAQHHTCPACLRTQEDFPAGIVTLSGGFAADRHEALLAQARQEEAIQNAEHPLQRIMAIRAEDGRTVISTTDPHLAQRIGSAIAHAFGGKLIIHYPEDEYMVRVDWSRPA